MRTVQDLGDNWGVIGARNITSVNTEIYPQRCVIKLHNFLLSFGATSPSGSRPSHLRRLKITPNNALQSVGLLLNEWSARRRDVWQHTALLSDRHPWHWWDSNPQFYQANGRKPTPKTSRPLGHSNCKTSPINCKLHHTLWIGITIQRKRELFDNFVHLFCSRTAKNSLLKAAINQLKH
jgi:hypothetical protein